MGHLLIVDDTKFSRGRVVAAIKDLGHTWEEAEHGQAALEAIAARTPDLIITDLLMPVLDGFGLLRELQARGLSLPVIVCSADIQASSRAESLALGAVAFVTKPFTADVVRDLVRTRLAGLVGSVTP